MRHLKHSLLAINCFIKYTVQYIQYYSCTKLKFIQKLAIFAYCSREKIIRLLCKNRIPTVIDSTERQICTRTLFNEANQLVFMLLSSK